MISDMGTSMARENLQHVRLVDRTTVASRLLRRPAGAAAARDHARDHIVERRGAYRDALNLVRAAWMRRPLASRLTKPRILRSLSSTNA